MIQGFFIGGKFAPHMLDRLICASLSRCLLRLWLGWGSSSSTRQSRISSCWGKAVASCLTWDTDRPHPPALLIFCLMLPVSACKTACCLAFPYSGGKSDGFVKEGIFIELKSSQLEVARPPLLPPPSPSYSPPPPPSMGSPGVPGLY